MAQSSSPLISYWHPDITYDFTLRIGEEDYSTDLVRVEIRTSVTAPYQHIFLDVFMDPHDILLNELFGQQNIVLSIKLKGKIPEAFEPVDFLLMYIDIESDYMSGQKSHLSDQAERSITRFKTVCIGSYQTMSQMVNKIYFNKTPYDIITDILKSTRVTETKYDTAGRSTLAIDQLLIPPTTVYNVINYIDRTYGVFNGPMGLYTTFDNKIKIQNLNKKPNESEAFLLHILATDEDTSKVTGSTDPKVFYTKTPVKNSYKGNAVFSVEAPVIKYIVKPKDKLSQTLEVNLETIAKSYGIIEKNNPKIYNNKVAISTTNRIGIEKDQTGYDSDKTFINANLSQNIADMSTTIAEVSGNLPTLNLMEVGEHVKVISHSDGSIKLGGSYILKGSDIQFIRSRTWDSFARLYMTRTNVASQ